MAGIRYLTDLIVPYEDTRILPALKRRHRLGVATNGTSEAQRGKLRKAGLAALFDIVVVSAEIGVAKPDPAFYETVREAAAAPAEDVIVVGDNVARDLLPALSVGMRAVWVRREGDTPQEVPWDGPAVTSLDDLESVLAAF